MYLAVLLLLLYPIEPYLWLRSMEGLGFKYVNHKRYYRDAALGYYGVTVLKQLVTIKLHSDLVNTVMGLVLITYIFSATIILYKGKVVEKLAWVGVFFGLIFVTEMAVLFIPTFIFKVPSEMYNKPTAWSVGCTFVAKLLLWGVCNFFYRRGKSNIMHSVVSNWEIMPLCLVTVLFEMPASAIIKSYKLQDSIIAMGACLIVQLMLIIFTLYMFFVAKHRNEQLDYVMAELENEKRASKATDKLSRLQHDICGHVDIMYSLCKSKQYDFLEKYIAEVYEATESLDTVHMLCDPALSVLIGDMHKRAKNMGIRFDIISTINKVYISSFDICSLVSNLLNNALEGTVMLPVTSRRIKLIIDYIKGGYCIQCINTSLAGVSIKNTSKKDKENHGYGRKIVESIVKKNHGKVIWSESIEEDGTHVFVATIEFKIKEIKIEQTKMGIEVDT